MESSEKKKYAYAVRTKGKSALESIKKFISTCDIDETDFRSLYILLSYGVEMILKSTIILSYDSDCKKCLDQDLKYLSHDLTKISKKIGEVELDDIGIESIKSEKEKYINSDENFYYYNITTTDGRVMKIENFVDIRYPNSGIRSGSSKEILEYIATAEYILKKIDKKIDQYRK